MILNKFSIDIPDSVFAYRFGNVKLIDQGIERGLTIEFTDSKPNLAQVRNLVKKAWHNVNYYDSNGAFCSGEIHLSGLEIKPDNSFDVEYNFRRKAD
jgi:hypothetical protein